MQNSDYYLTKFDPFRDYSGWVEEDSDAYASRMQQTLLSNWPKEVLTEWLHRNAGSLDKYAFLGFENLSFERLRWPADIIPGVEAFDDPRFPSEFQNLKERAKNPHDWLARYMLDHFTWNTPIILLDNPDRLGDSTQTSSLRSPYHLLEGHRRLAFFLELRRLNIAAVFHDVWVAKHSLIETNRSIHSDTDATRNRQ